MLKQLYRSRGFQRFLAGVFSTWLKVCYATMTWTREGQEKPEGVWKTPGGAILCFWHARIPLSPMSWPQSPDRQEMRALISLSADGEFIAQTVERIGFPAIRGSSQKKSDLSKNKQGEVAFREMIKWVRGGGAVAITPDGPRGPAEAMEPGTPSLARMTGAPVLLVGMACKPCIRIGSWDRTVIPLPFTRGAIAWDGPLTATRDDDLEALTAEWAGRLSAITRRAEAMLDAGRAK